MLFIGPLVLVVWGIGFKKFVDYSTEYIKLRSSKLDRFGLWMLGVFWPIVISFLYIKYNLCQYHIQLYK